MKIYFAQLAHAITTANVSAFELLIQHIPAEELTNTDPETGNTILHLLCAQQRQHKELITHDIEIARCLLKRLKQLNMSLKDFLWMQNKANKTALEMGFDAKNNPVLQVLIFETEILSIFTQERLAEIKVYLERFPFIAQVQDKDGNTLLHHVASSSQAEGIRAAKLLDESAANLITANAEKQTALDLAKLNQKSVLIAWLVFNTEVTSLIAQIKVAREKQFEKKEMLQRLEKELQDCIDKCPLVLTIAKDAGLNLQEFLPSQEIQANPILLTHLSYEEVKQKFISIKKEKTSETISFNDVFSSIDAKELSYYDDLFQWLSSFDTQFLPSVFPWTDINSLNLIQSCGLSLKDLRNRQGQTLLHQAVLNGDYAGVEFLLKNGIDFKVVDQFGMAALHYACIQNQTEIVKTLCNAYGAEIPSINVLKPTDEQITDAQDAITELNLEELENLLNQGMSAQAKHSGEKDNLIQTAVNKAINIYRHQKNKDEKRLTALKTVVLLLRWNHVDELSKFFVTVSPNERQQPYPLLKNLFELFHAYHNLLDAVKNGKKTNISGAFVNLYRSFEVLKASISELPQENVRNWLSKEICNSIQSFYYDVLGNNLLHLFASHTPQKNKHLSAEEYQESLLYLLNELGLNLFEANKKDSLIFKMLWNEEVFPKEVREIIVKYLRQQLAFNCIENGDVNKLYQLLEAGLDINTTKLDGTTLLMVAVQKQNIAIVEMLCNYKKQPDICLKNNHNNHVFDFVSAATDPAILKALQHVRHSALKSGLLKKSQVYVAADLVRLHPAINFSYELLPKEALIALCKILSEDNTLHYLNLSHMGQIDADVIEVLNDVLSKNPALEILDLSGNAIDDSGLAKLMGGLSLNKKLHKLDLSHNALTDKGVNDALDTLKQHPRVLVNFNNNAGVLTWTIETVLEVFITRDSKQVENKEKTESWVLAQLTYLSESKMILNGNLEDGFIWFTQLCLPAIQKIDHAKKNLLNKKEEDLTSGEAYLKLLMQWHNLVGEYWQRWSNSKKTLQDEMQIGLQFCEALEKTLQQPWVIKNALTQKASVFKGYRVIRQLMFEREKTSYIEAKKINLSEELQSLSGMQAVQFFTQECLNALILFKQQAQNVLDTVRIGENTPFEQERTQVLKVISNPEFKSFLTEIPAAIGDAPVSSLHQGRADLLSKSLFKWCECFASKFPAKNANSYHMFVLMVTAVAQAFASQISLIAFSSENIYSKNNAVREQAFLIAKHLTHWIAVKKLKDLDEETIMQEAVQWVRFAPWFNTSLLKTRTGMLIDARHLFQSTAWYVLNAEKENTPYITEISLSANGKDGKDNVWHLQTRGDIFGCSLVHAKETVWTEVGISNLRQNFKLQKPQPKNLAEISALNCYGPVLPHNEKDAPLIMVAKHSVLSFVHYGSGQSFYYLPTLQKSFDEKNDLRVLLQDELENEDIFAVKISVKASQEKQDQFKQQIGSTVNTINDSLKKSDEDERENKRQLQENFETLKQQNSLVIKQNVMLTQKCEELRQEEISFKKDYEDRLSKMEKEIISVKAEQENLQQKLTHENQVLKNLVGNLVEELQNLRNRMEKQEKLLGAKGKDEKSIEALPKITIFAVSPPPLTESDKMEKEEKEEEKESSSPKTPKFQHQTQ